MDIGITYAQAQDLLNKYISDKTTRLHLRETEVFMCALARKFNEDEEKWGIIGLLHDLDWDLTKNNQAEHCIKLQEILKQAGGSDFLIETIVSHGYGYEIIPPLAQKQRLTRIQFCLAAAETLTGLIVVSALVRPEKKLSVVSLSSLKSRFKEKKFAAKCDRNIILECERAGIKLDDFLQIGLSSLQSIAEELGL